ncbi:hypothetical protein [Vibrio parahaemolyticus]|uniref:hypothetical protein n=1 Tax=Vibrio parahaemolyticus TaxID=670 RepID=UPI001A8FE7EC|nr:hypothetical protein [Vibrio parahaemolyticus]EJG1188092.1 hypothetical protein [Vibrio parahaemolyticus]MBO0170300.1 hypothetical protein [Vibrio parahaemolyticus]MDF4755654.1 hypothetical protein [Vibrio parahaemolyticus]MDF4781884.1 hypothetical protein [Vibrio parahaemolyticus]MDF4786711.1 hypothetical protein [Vibrio parahaemolyticus]
MNRSHKSLMQTIAMYTWITVGFCFRFLFGNLYGVLVTMVIVRAFSESLFGFPPYSTYELITWLYSLSDEMKVAIASSLVTVVGFFIAYASATANWKSQLLASIKLQASSDLNSFFTEVNSLVTDLEIYAQDVVKSLDVIRDSSDDNEKMFQASYFTELGQGIDIKRKRLVSMSIQVHHFEGKYSSLFISVPSVLPSFRRAASALNNVSSASWFYIPCAYRDDPNPVESYVSHIDRDKYESFIRSVNKNRILLSFYPGSAGGVLQSDVVPFNVFSLVNLFKNSKLLHGVFDEVRRAKKDG